MAGSGAALSHGELEKGSARLARWFVDHGLAPGDGVALLAGNSARLFEVYWAALRCGLVLTAVNHHLTAAEVAYIVRDCGARVVITSPRYGDATFYSVGFSSPLTKSTSYVIELNGRITKKDRNEDGSLDSESGGHLAYLSLSLRQNLGQNYGLVVGYQLPVIDQLNGHQHEGGIFSISVSRLF